MEALTLENVLQRYLRMDRERTQMLATALLVALIGIELAVLVAWMPDTLQTWWRASPRGDFGDFFKAAQHLQPNGLYSPALSLFIYPLTLLSIENAYRVYLALGMGACLGMAYLAQRGVSSPAAKVAVVLGVLSVPQMHWALRLGHVTPFLALAALGGFLLLRHRPAMAGLCFALLVLKPQYAPVPALYLLWSRNWRALGAFTLGALMLEVAGFAAAGFGEIGGYLHGFVDWGSDSRDNLVGVQRAWQYSWSGFLVSAGVEPNPLVVFDLILVSAVVVWLAWARASSTVALAAAAAGMLLISPYANFYDWGLLIVAGALLLRAETPMKSIYAVAIVAIYGALVMSMDATPFPHVDARIIVSGTTGQLSFDASAVPTNGIYWVTPLALALVAMVALAGGRRREATEAPLALPQPRTFSLRPSGLIAVGVLVPAAYFAAAFFANVAPFETHFDPFAPSEVVRQVPQDFPLPDDSALRDAGKGQKLPYHIEWTTSEPVSQVAGIYRHLVDGSSQDWKLMLDEEQSPSYKIRLARFTSGFMTHWAMLDVSPYENGSRISLDLFVSQTLSIAARGRDK